jgi:oxygen-independent coproporphyrinogen-3 oxidase
MNPDTSIYLHIPFCKHRCAYCDFNTYAGQEGQIPAYVDALIREIGLTGRKFEASPQGGAFVHTVFFGGGTPSLLSVQHLTSIMDALRTAFLFRHEVETTLEANPGTTSAGYLQEIHAAGFNRISFGVQSANPDELHLLERVHDFFDVIQSVKWARKAGFLNINLDIIYGLPEQSLSNWQNTVRRIIDLHPEHISAYALTLEHGTPFGQWSAHGLLPLPNPDLAAEMYEWTCETLELQGYAQYEISNWARNDSDWTCRHNLQYWRGLPYLGIGAGAHGYAGGIRYSNVLRIKSYIDRMVNPQAANLSFPLTPAAVNQHHQTARDDMGEFMLTGLRLTREGVSLAEFKSRFGQKLMDVFGSEVGDLIRLGLLEEQNQGLRLTRRGRLLGNQVFIRFVD